MICRRFQVVTVLLLTVNRKECIRFIGDTIRLKYQVALRVLAGFPIFLVPFRL